MNIKETAGEGVDWINLVQDRDEWWAVMNAVLKRRVP
jgi:hypothetical protein